MRGDQFTIIMALRSCHAERRRKNGLVNFGLQRTCWPELSYRDTLRDKLSEVLRQFVLVPLGGQDETLQWWDSFDVSEVPQPPQLVLSPSALAKKQEYERETT